MRRENPFGTSALMAAMMTAIMYEAGYRTYHEIVKLPKTIPPWHGIKLPKTIPPWHGINLSKTIPPWHGINLSKAERKGKTFEQLQEMRRARWEEMHGKEDC